MKTSPEFVFAKGLSVGARLMWIGLLALFGVALQLLVSPAVGWVFVLVAVLLSIARSVSNQPAVIRASEWQNVTMAEVEAALALLSTGDRVKRSAGSYSCTSAAGCLGAVFLLVCVAVAAITLAGVADQGVSDSRLFDPVSRGGSLAFVFAADALTLFVPMWIFGRVKTWEPPHMRLRLGQLMHIYKVVSTNPKLDFQPSLQVAKTDKGSVPIDCKLMVKVKDTDPGFMGIQVQTSLNDVQGKKHPYTYCVLIAKPEFGLVRKAKQVVEMPPEGGFRVGYFADSNEKKERKFARFQGALVELKKEGDVEIAVVRQKTSGTGYKTSPDQAMAVFSAAYQLAQGVLAQ